MMMITMTDGLQKDANTATVATVATLGPGAVNHVNALNDIWSAHSISFHCHFSLISVKLNWMRVHGFAATAAA